MEVEKNKFKEEQQRMINKVKKQIGQITAQYNMKQQEETKLGLENKAIEDKKAYIHEQRLKLAQTKELL